MNSDRPSTDEIIAKYSSKLQTQIETEGSTTSEEAQTYSEEYEQFRREMVPELNRYERWATTLGNIIKIKVSQKDRIKIEKSLKEARLSVTPEQAATFAIMSLLGTFFLTILLSVAYFLISFGGSLSAATSTQVQNLLMFVFLGVLASVFVFYYTYTMPKRLANVWRLRASAEMVPAILYLVVYMKHTSNLERAIAFAAQHLEGPLALDFKKIFYDVEIGKFSTVKQSLENYLEQWREDAPEFVESVHLIESSLFEPSESRRIEILVKSLLVILDGVYEKMLKYSREIRTPLTNIYMLGIILPTLGLALLPLASTLLGGILRWPHVFILFNVIVPFMVFYIVSEILLKRPSGYGETSNLQYNPEYQNYLSKKPVVNALAITVPLIIIGLLPFLFQIPTFTETLGLKNDYTFAELGISSLGDGYIFDFKNSDGQTTGPFGPGAMLLSLFIPLSIALFFIMMYGGKTKNLIKSRQDTKRLEQEFANSLFQLGNRIGDGLPAEIAFSKVAASTEGQKSGEFFRTVSSNINQFGMSVENSVFDKDRGAIIYFPSALIATSMRILVESVKKGLQVAARSLMSISEYVKNIEKINQRLRDLLAEIVSDMKSNMTFLAPLLAGIVVGLSGMITFILNKLDFLQSGAGDSGMVGLGSLGSIMEIFQVNTMIPPYYIQVSIGIYIVQIVFILTGALVTVDAGKDTLREKYELARYLKRSIFLYTATALASVFALTVLAAIALGGLGG